MTAFLLGLPHQPPPQPLPGAPPELPSFLLSGMVWVPVLVALALLLFPDRTDLQRERIRTGAGVASAVVAAFGVVMWFGFREQGGQFAYEEKHPWIPGFGASYHLGVDGVSMPLLLLSALVFFIAVLASTRIRERVKEFFVLLLVVEAGVNGVFAALDYLLFFLFWEMTLVPTFLLIGLWGGAGRLYAAWKFLIFNVLAGSVMGLAIFIMVVSAPKPTFDILALHDARLPAAIAPLLFAMFLLAFAVVLPAFPFHSWLPDALAEAPTPVAMIVGGVLIKLGGYGLYRVNVGQFPDILHRFSGVGLQLAVFTILWGGLAALMQDDVKRVVGYAAVSQAGFYGLAAASAASIALDGGVLMMVASGLTISLLVLAAGIVSDRTGTRSIKAMGGLAARMPRTAVVWGLAALAAVGIPGLIGFPAELLIFLGAYPVHRVAVSVAVLGLVLTAGVLLWTQRRIFFGSLPERYERLRDAGTLDLSAAVTLVVAIFLVGIFPGLLVDSINFGVLALLTRIGG